VRGNLDRVTNLDVFGRVSDEVDESSDWVGTSTKSFENLLVLVQDLFGNQPNKVVLFGPLVEYVGTWILAWKVGFFETGYAHH